MSDVLDIRMAQVIQAAGVLLPPPPEGEPRQLKDKSYSYLFYNFGNIYDPQHMWEVASCFASRIAELQLHKMADFIFGPAYKGIGLAHLISVALWTNHGVKMNVCYNRKEAKEHGEGGVMVGYPIKSGERGLVIDDVLTAGTAKRESQEILSECGAVLTVVLVGVDRSPEGVLVALAEELGVEIFSVTTHDRIKGRFVLPEYASY